MLRYQISALQKKKLISMVKSLFNGTRRVFITQNGNVYVSKGIFRWVKVHILEMCTSKLPIKIKELHLELNSKAYDSVYNRYAYTVVDLLNTGKTAGDIIDYLYREYSLLKFNLQYINTPITVEIPEKTSSITISFLPAPVVSTISTKFLRGNFKRLISIIKPEEDSIYYKIKKFLRDLKGNYRRKKKPTQLRMLLQVNLK